MLVAASISTSAMAATDTNSWQDGAMDAWIDGKAEATLMFNGNLDSFDINTDVIDGKVTLTGKVDNEINRELAEELILGIDGVRGVDNMLTVVRDDDESESDMTAFTDTKISTVIKSRLLFDSEVSGTSINVDVENRVVTLTGDVKSDAEKQLALTIAKNADDVKSVNDKLMIKPRT
jgi:osmotically-inducible protein OsmY